MSLIDDEWYQFPPKPEFTLKAFVEDFTRRRNNQSSLLYHKMDHVVEYCRNSISLNQAIERAVASKDANGKHHNHQSKIFGMAYAPFCANISKKLEDAEFFTFDKLHDIIDTCKVSGIGPLFVYDVSVRIGAYLKLEPESVYMHAGAREGAKLLGFNTNVVRIPKGDFPDFMQHLSADEIEDFLCCYKSKFKEIIK